MKRYTLNAAEKAFSDKTAALKDIIQVYFRPAAFLIRRNPE